MASLTTKTTTNTTKTATKKWSSKTDFTIIENYMMLHDDITSVIPFSPNTIYTFYVDRSYTGSFNSGETFMGSPLSISGFYVTGTIKHIKDNEYVFQNFSCDKHKFWKCINTIDKIKFIGISHSNDLIFCGPKFTQGERAGLYINWVLQIKEYKKNDEIYYYNPCHKLIDY